MKQVTISKNDGGQRFDRFLRKYLENAPLSVIQKNIRKKNFKINDVRAKADMFVAEGDVISMYISDEAYEKWVRKTDFKPSDFDLDIVYEDENIIIIDKKAGILTHAVNKEDYGNNLVDQMLSYLYKSLKVNPRDNTFTPAVVNRLDRNTAGLVIGAKNAKALRALNKAVREQNIDKFYLTLVKGKVDHDFTIDTSISKNKSRNKVKANKAGDRIITHFRPLETNGKYSLVECELITGKTHQIRFSLKKNASPIVGDRKYGDPNTNKFVGKKFHIENQVLLAYKIRFGQVEGFAYLEGKEFESKQTNELLKLKEELFKL